MNSETVLIVDDSELMRDKLESSLQPLEFESIVKVTGGEKAIEAFENESIGLTFLDIEMPDLDGIETLKKLKAINPEAHVVMVSGEGTMTNVKSALALGAKGFIVKPYVESKIQEAVSNYRTNSAAN